MVNSTRFNQGDKLTINGTILSSVFVEVLLTNFILLTLSLMDTIRLPNFWRLNILYDNNMRPLIMH